MGLDILGLDILGTTRALLLVGVVRAMYRCDQVEKDGKVYIERVPGSERGFKHLTEREEWLVLKTAILCFPSRCSRAHRSFYGVHRVVAGF